MKGTLECAGLSSRAYAEVVRRQSTNAARKHAGNREEDGRGSASRARQRQHGGGAQRFAAQGGAELRIPKKGVTETSTSPPAIVTDTKTGAVTKGLQRSAAALQNGRQADHSDQPQHDGQGQDEGWKTAMSRRAKRTGV